MTAGSRTATGERLPSPARPRLSRLILAAPRAALIALVLLVFFVLGVPLQLRRARRRPADDRLPKLFCRILLWLVGVAVEVRGRPSGSAALLAANHVSWIDIPALAATTPFCFLAKAEVGRWPIVSAFAAVQGTVYVDRRRRRSILPANRAIAARLAEGRHVLIFPEGTTLAGPLPGPFLSSHFAAPALGAARAAVQPVALAYSSPAAAWVGEGTLIGHLWRTLLAPPLRCVVAFGEPMPPPRGGARAGDRRKAAARQAGDAVSALVIVAMGADAMGADAMGAHAMGAHAMGADAMAGRATAADAGAADAGGTTDGGRRRLSQNMQQSVANGVVVAARSADGPGRKGKEEP